MPSGMSHLALYVAFLSLGISFVAIAFVIVTFGRLAEIQRGEFGDPSAYTVVTDGKFYRVRGPFDTFYTIRFSDRTEAEKYAAQLASWYRELEENNEGKWRAAA